jgi:hypothetical protein
LELHRARTWHGSKLGECLRLVAGREVGECWFHGDLFLCC